MYVQNILCNFLLLSLLRSSIDFRLWFWTVKNWSWMSRGFTWTHIQSVWIHSGPSEVPYPTNKLVVRNFFCYFLQQTGSRLVVLKLGYHCKGVKNVYIVNTENVQTTDHATHILQLFFWFRLGRTSLISAAICQCCCKKKE